MTLFGDMPAPVGAEDFNVESDTIKRRRAAVAKMLEAAPGEHGWGAVGAELIRGLARGYVGNQLSEQERDVSRRRSEFADAWLKRRPTGQAAQEEIEGTGPIAPPPGTPGVEESGGGMDLMNTPEPGANAKPSAFSTAPRDTPAGWVGPNNSLSMLPQGVTDFKPNRAEKPFLPPSLDDTSLWAAEGAGLSPWHGALASHAMQRSMDVPVELEKARVLAAARKEEKETERISREREKEVQRIETARRDAERAAETRANQEARAAGNINRDRQHAIDMESLKVQLAAQKGPTVKAKFDGYDNDGNRVLARPDGVQVTLQPMKDAQGKVILDEKGQPTMEHIVHTGEVIPTAVAEKAAAKVFEFNAAIKDAEAAIKAVKDNPDAFGFKSYAATKGVLGLAAKKSGFITPEEVAAQTTVFRTQADIVHKIYGAALTAGEDVAKAAWAPIPGESDEMVARKLDQALAYAERQVKSAPKVARSLAQRRSDSDQRPPLSRM
jgi:hypothetical protein